jgi:hypothetical protein
VILSVVSYKEEKILPEDKKEKDDTPGWKLLASFGLVNVLSLLLLIFIYTSFEYGLMWWVLVIFLSIFTVLIFLITIVVAVLLRIYKRIESLPKEKADLEIQRLLESSRFMRFLYKILNIGEEEGELKTIKISTIKMDSTGLSLYNKDNVSSKTISWRDIKKLYIHYKGKLRTFYCVLILINEKHVYLNAEIGKREGVEIFRNMKKSYKKYTKGVNIPEKEYSGKFKYIYYE